MAYDSAALPADQTARLTPRDYAGVNWLGMRTLYQREVRRFQKVWMQTVAAPVVTTLLYMLIFVVAVGADRQVHAWGSCGAARRCRG